MTGADSRFVRSARLGAVCSGLTAIVAAGCGHVAPRLESPTVVASPPPRAPAPPTVAAPIAPPPPPPCADADLVGCTNGCDDGRWEDCATLGAMLLAGETVSVDRERAVSLFRRACGGGSARGCLRLGDAYRDGLATGVADETAAYRRACEAGANQGCLAAGLAYLDGRGVKADPAEAAGLFQRVCEKGNAPSCLELGRLYEVGEGVARDRRRAFDLYEKGCQLGSDAACIYARRREDVP